GCASTACTGDACSSSDTRVRREARMRMARGNATSVYGWRSGVVPAIRLTFANGLFQGENVDVLSQGRAAVYEEPIGPAGVRIRERPRTEPKPGFVAIAIANASINHLDLWLAHGAQRVTPPRVIAADGAGVVHASG